MSRSAAKNWWKERRDNTRRLRAANDWRDYIAENYEMIISPFAYLTPASVFEDSKDNQISMLRNHLLQGSGLPTGSTHDGGFSYMFRELNEVIQFTKADALDRMEAFMQQLSAAQSNPTPFKCTNVEVLATSETEWETIEPTDFDRAAQMDMDEA